MKYPKLKLDFPLIALIAVNILILFQAIRSNLDVVSTLLIYWSESAIIGFFIVIGMLLSKHEFDRGQRVRAKLFGVPFFIAHYSLFLFVHLIFIIVLGNNLAQNQNFDILGYLLGLKSVIFYSLLLFASHLVSFITEFVIPKEYEETDVWNLMFVPYRRVFLMQLTIILGAGLVILTGNPKSIIFLLFIPLKIIFDVYAHVKEHEEYRDED